MSERGDTYWIVKFVDEGEIDIMLKMMKYEYRRGVFSLLVVITALAAAELLFLIGIFAEKDRQLILYALFATKVLILCRNLDIQKSNVRLIWNLYI